MQGQSGHQKSHKKTLWCEGMDLEVCGWWQGWHIARAHQQWRSDSKLILLETKERPAFFSAGGRTSCTKWGVSLQPLRAVQYCWVQCWRLWGQVLWTHAEASWAPQPRTLELPHHACHSSSSIKCCHILNTWKLQTVEPAFVRQVMYT